MNHKIYLFDFDGTLVDSMSYWSQSMLNIPRLHNKEYPEDVVKIITPLGWMGTAKYFKETLNVPMELPEMLQLMYEQTLPKYCHVIERKEGVLEYLSMLKQNGCSLNILTASPHIAVDPCLKRNEIYHLFDNVWSSDDFNMTKSNPEIYGKVAERLGVKIKDIAFFDDNLKAIQTASRAGLFTVGVYDDSGKDFTEELKKASHVYAETLKGFPMV